MQADLATGTILPLTRTIDARPDPLALYKKLCEDRAGVALLESADMAGDGQANTIIMTHAALKAECRGSDVIFEALTPNGHRAMDVVGERLSSRARLAAEKGRLVASFDTLSGGSMDARLHAPSPMDALRAMAMGWELVSEPHRLVLPTIGAFAFDFVEFYEPLPEAPSDLGDFPDFVFWLPESLLLLDHERGVLTAVAHVFGGENSRVSYNDAIARLEEMLAASKEVASLDTPGESVACSTAMKADAPPHEVDVSDALFAGHVSELKEKIVDGEIFQVVPSRTFFTPCSDSLAAYRMLRLSNPSPYMFHLAADDFELFGASPETCIAVEQNGQKRIVQIRPIAGTRSRGFDANGAPDSDLDSRLEVELRTDTKELAEHMMLVDLARNDIARVSKPGTREVARLLSVDRYQHVMHLVSSVRGELRDDLDALHAYVACMNMGTLTGAPKVRAAQLLREIEGGRRGPYGGAIGYVTHDGEMDSAIIIRSALVRDGIAHIRAGAGVVHDSHPESEARETFKKARSVLGAIEASRRTSPGGSR